MEVVEEAAVDLVEEVVEDLSEVEALQGAVAEDFHQEVVVVEALEAEGEDRFLIYITLACNLSFYLVGS